MSTSNLMYNGMDASHWWEKDTKDVWSDVYTLVKTSENTQSGLQTSNLSYLKAYLGRDIRQTTTAGYFMNATAEQTEGLLARPRPKFNVVASSIDTLISKISKNKVKPTALTSGGMIEQKTRAENLNQFMHGILLQHNVWDTCKEAFRNALVFGTGFVKVSRDGKKMCYESVFPDEIVIDPADGYYGNPMCWYQRKHIQKAQLIRKFPEHVDAISRMQGINSMYTPDSKDMVLVVEAWKRGDDGRHVIVADGATFLDEKFSDDFFPFATIRYRKQPIGFWGVGVAEILYGIQSDIDRISATISDILRLMSRPRIFIESSSKVNPRHINNDVGTFVPFSGTPPIINAPNTVPPELFMERETLIERAYREVGLNDMSTSGRKPAGLDSGKAIREFTDIETERFAETSNSWEQLFIDIANLTASVLDKSPSFEVSAPTLDNGLRRMKWSDVRLPRNDYLYQTYPTSALSSTPAGRLADVKEMMAIGLIEPDVGVELLNFPDLKSESRVASSPRRLIMQTLEKIVTEGKYITPEPYFPLQLAKKMAQQFFCLCKLNEVADDRLSLVQDFIEDVLVIEQRVKDEMQQMQMEAQMAASPAQAAVQSQLAAPVAAQVAPGTMFQG